MRLLTTLEDPLRRITWPDVAAGAFGGVVYAMRGADNLIEHYVASPSTTYWLLLLAVLVNEAGKGYVTAMHPRRVSIIVVLLVAGYTLVLLLTKGFAKEPALAWLPWVTLPVLVVVELRDLYKTLKLLRALRAESADLMSLRIGRKLDEAAALPVAAPAALLEEPLTPTPLSDAS